MARVLIAGAGDLGTRLGLLLAGESSSARPEVWALRRSAEKVPSPLRPLAADLTDASSLGALPEAIDVVFYTTAADGRDEAAYRRAYVDGLRNLLEALDAPLARVIFSSSTSVYGQESGEWVDEDSRAEPTSFRGRIMLEAEALLHRSLARTTAVRFAGIYGPGRRRLIDSILDGETAISGGSPRYTNRIHIEDAARVLRHVADLDEPASTYVAVDSAPVAEAEVKTWLAGELGVPSPPVDADATSSRRRGGNKRCSNRRLLDSGFELRYPDYRAGYRALIDDVSR